MQIGNRAYSTVYVGNARTLCGAARYAHRVRSISRRVRGISSLMTIEDTLYRPLALWLRDRRQVPIQVRLYANR